MKNFARMLLIGAYTVLAHTVSAQTLYDNFENKRLVSYPNSSGVLNQSGTNLENSGANRSTTCGSYTRSATTQYDYLIVKPSKMGDVSAYSSGEKRMTMKFRGPAAGTVVQISLQNTAKAQSNKHPSGRYAGNFKATTATANVWETLSFVFVPSSPENIDPTVGPKDVDRLVISIAPNTTSGETYYFDDLMGPE